VHFFDKMSCCSIELSLSNLVLLGALAFVVKKLIGLYHDWKFEKVLEQFKNTPKDKVILHTVWRGKTLPSVSPFATKLETYLKANKIPYELDTKNPESAKGRLPWITYNGTHVADSHLIIQYLNKKLGINMNNGKSEEQIATARACRIILEEHFINGLVYFRMIENIGKVTDLLHIPTAFKLFLPLMRWNIKKRLDSNGIGKHTPTEIYQMTEDDLRTVSSLLGKKKFFGGDDPCEDDCGVFGCVAQAVWALPGSTYERLVNGELINLKQYCERMKERCWPDWDNLIDKSS